MSCWIIHKIPRKLQTTVYYHWDCRLLHLFETVTLLFKCFCIIIRVQVDVVSTIPLANRTWLTTFHDGAQVTHPAHHRDRPFVVLVYHGSHRVNMDSIMVSCQNHHLHYAIKLRGPLKNYTTTLRRCWKCESEFWKLDFSSWLIVVYN